MVSVILAAVILLWARRAGVPWRALGFVRPRRILWPALACITAGVVMKILMKAVVMSLLAAPPLNRAYAFAPGDGAALADMLFTVIVGVPGAEQGMIMGLVFGGLFAATGQLWLSMLVHAAFDVTAVLAIYFGAEGAMAHLVFR